MLLAPSGILPEEILKSRSAKCRALRAECSRSPFSFLSRCHSPALLPQSSNGSGLPQRSFRKKTRLRAIVVQTPYNFTPVASSFRASSRNPVVKRLRVSALLGHLGRSRLRFGILDPGYNTSETRASKLLLKLRFEPRDFVKKILFLLAIVGLWSAHRYLHRSITYPPGMLVASEPTQVNLPVNTPPFDFGEFHLKPLARFAADARLIHSEIYRFDRQAALVPIDLAVGWGPMSDQQVLDKLRVTQSMRFFWYEYKLPPPIPVEQIVSHATNIHIIPSTPGLASLCKSLRWGMLVHLDGELVEATGPHIGTWRSSLTRTDSGNGACELLYLEKMEVLSADAVLRKTRLVQR